MRRLDTPQTIKLGWLDVTRSRGSDYSFRFLIGARTLFAVWLSPGYFWLRAGGHGIHVKRADLPLLFSQRSGAWPSVRLGPVRVNWL